MKYADPFAQERIDQLEYAIEDIHKYLSGLSKVGLKFYASEILEDVEAILKNTLGEWPDQA